MDERQPPPTRNPSRTLAKIAVAVLVVIAIAGIVLATLRGRGAPADTPVAADATQPAASAMTAAAASAAAAEVEAGPNQVVFAPGSIELSDPATAKLQRIADAARKDKRDLVILAKVEARPDGAQQRVIAQNRTSAVRGVLETSGVPLGKMQIRIAEEALGLVSAKEANSVEVSPR